MQKFDVVEWMYKYGHPSYKNRILELKEQVRVLALDDPGSVEIDHLIEEIEEIKREAYDRYQDWVTDPLN